MWRHSSSTDNLSGNFSIAISCIISVVGRYFSRISALLLWVGVLTATPTIRAVIWGRSPVCALLFLAIGLTLFCHKTHNHPTTSQKSKIPESAIHWGLLFSGLATLCRNDLIAIHAALLSIAMLHGIYHRKWLSIARLAPWGLVLLIPILTSIIFFRHPLAILDLMQYYLDITSNVAGISETAAGQAQWTDISHSMQRGLQNRGSILQPLSLLFSGLGFFSIYRKKRTLFWVMAGAVLSSLSATAIARHSGVYSSRQFFFMRLLLLLLSAAGIDMCMARICSRKARWGLLILLTLGLLYWNRNTYIDQFRVMQRHAATYQQHAIMAETIRSSPLLTDAQIVVQDRFSAFIFRNRLHRNHNNVLSEHEFMDRRLRGEPPPPEWSYVREKTNSRLYQHYRDLIPKPASPLQVGGLIWLIPNAQLNDGT